MTKEKMGSPRETQASPIALAGPPTCIRPPAEVQRALNWRFGGGSDASRSGNHKTPLVSRDVAVTRPLRESTCFTCLRLIRNIPLCVVRAANTGMFHAPTDYRIGNTGDPRLGSGLLCHVGSLLRRQHFRPTAAHFSIAGREYFMSARSCVKLDDMSSIAISTDMSHASRAR